MNQQLPEEQVQREDLDAHFALIGAVCMLDDLTFQDMSMNELVLSGTLLNVFVQSGCQ